MRIVPYRVRFEPDKDADTGKYRYSKPTNDRLPVPLSKDGTYYCISTHDRGNNEKSDSYYQIAFKIEDPSPYTLEELSLHLDSAIYRNAGMQISNDLFCDPTTRLDQDKNLWFQRSLYEQKNDEWKIVAENKRGALNVDCITTAGVFGIVIKRNGIVLEQYKLPWIYVLPSSITKEDYIDMLSDLIRLNEALVRNDRHATGIGTMTMLQYETNLINTEKDIINNFIDLLRKIMNQPSELLRKQYVKSAIQKIKHFDVKVLRDYIRNIGAPKVTEIEYVEDYDTYEHRVIKFVVEKLCQRPPLSFDESVTDDKVTEYEVIEEYKRLTKLKEIEYEPTITRLPLYGVPQRGLYRPLRIVIDKNKVEMSGHNALRGEGGDYNRLILYASTKNELLFYLEELIKCYESLDRRPHFTIECSLLGQKISRDGRYDVPSYYIKNIKKINEKLFNNNDSSDIDDDKYTKIISDLEERYEYLIINNNIFYPRYIFSKKTVKIDQDAKEREKMENEIRLRLKEKKTKSLACRQLNKKNEELKKLYTSSQSWFSRISLLPSMTEIRKSPKFINNPLYAQLYNLIIQLVKMHPLLCASFDLNAFGVSSTQLVYEYWVFYKILYQLNILGFEFVDRDRQQKDLIEHFRNFITLRNHTEKYSQYRANLLKQSDINPIEIEIGYDMLFQAVCRSRRPDFYLCIKHDTARHWFFLDAKYKSYSRNSYYKEIYETSIIKYIYEMSEILKEHSNYHIFDNNILGSYIIMANSEDRDTPLADNNRLFGGRSDIALELPANINNSKNLPEHRYGAIVLTPHHDNELTSLFQLIFEYLDGNRTDNADGHPNLNLFQCWSCGSEDIQREQRNTIRGLSKYYVTCNRCGAFRVDTHCHNCSRVIGSSLIVKHIEGNYHHYDDGSDNRFWAFLCPHCGMGLNVEFEDVIESSIS